MPKRSRSGVVSSPARVVAPISVNAGRSMRDHAGPRALADGDRQPAVLHRRDRRSPRARAAAGASRRRRTPTRGSSAVRNAATSPLRSSAGPAVGTKPTPSSAATMPASDVLPRPGGPASSTWSSGSPRAQRRLDRQRELLLDLVLPDEVLEPLGAQRAVEVLLGELLRGLDAAAGVVIGGPRAGPRRSGPRRCRPRTSASSASTSGGAKPSPSRPSRARPPRVVGVDGAVIEMPSSSDGGADLLAQLDDDPLGRALADAGHGLEAARRRRRRWRTSSSRGEPPESTASATFGPDRLHADQEPGRGRARPRWRSRTAFSASSRTIRWACRVTCLPTGGTCRSVSAETASR